MLRTSASIFLICVLRSLVFAQTPPSNPFFVNSPFPAVHGGNYRQASQTLPGPTTNQLDVIYTDVPDRTASPWILYSDKYPNGERVMWLKNGTHVFKVLTTKTGLEVVATFPEGSKFKPNYNLLLFNNHELWFKRGNEFTVLTEADPSNPRSAIIVKRQFTVQGFDGELVKQGVLYDGNVVFTTKSNEIGVINRDGKVLDRLRFTVSRKDIPYHNDFAIDEKNNVYIVSNTVMLSFGWDGKKLKENWRAPYDFGGNRLQGSGTTPTLVGVGDGMDKLGVVCDSHTPANMVAFWRETPPTNWQALPGQSRQLAGVCALPGARPPRFLFTAIENSPVCWGYGIAAAQYNGFMGQSCNNLKGVYKCEWNPVTRKLELAWVRNDINFNNVLAMSTVSGLLYGSGREQDCNYYYYGLDWKTGQTAWRLRLGRTDEYDDPGDANVLDETGNLTFTTRRGIVQLRSRNRDLRR